MLWEMRDQTTNGEPFIALFISQNCACHSRLVSHVPMRVYVTGFHLKFGNLRAIRAPCEFCNHRLVASCPTFAVKSCRLGDGGFHMSLHWPTTRGLLFHFP